MGNSVLTMYDVRGIQNYIFRTSKVKDAIGASSIVENIIEDALADAVKQENIVSYCLDWESDSGVIEYTGADYDVQVLYVGGGNAFVLYSDATIAEGINRRMSRYVIDNTYSLQLAIAGVEYTGNYKNDYEKIYKEMNRIKAEMAYSVPLGALPVFSIDIQTGMPLTCNRDSQGKYTSTETFLKQKSEKYIRRTTSSEYKRFESYSTQKGTDSTIAIVHIDGNNMGTRIRRLLENMEDYVEAVNEMRKISYHINHAYKDAFSAMAQHFNSIELDNKAHRYYVLKILVAGDDITYVCNGKIALASVEYFCRQVTNMSMNGDTTDDGLRKYGFSVCAGISYQHDHFPFSIGYEVAENCCESAKTKAKLEENKDGERIGCWVDFQVCKNVRTQNLEDTREREYITSRGERLITRPYYVPVPKEFGLSKNDCGREDSLTTFKKYMKYFNTDDEKSGLPRSFAKKLRNLYSGGEESVAEFVTFLNSRQHKLPGDAYYEDGADRTARFYDVLELMDDYVDLECIDRLNSDEGGYHE